MSPRLEFAIETAWLAGRSTLEAFRAKAGYEVKGDGSPVTEADRRAEAVVREEVGRAFPGEPVFGEEEGGPGPGEDRWVVDPIDGTKSFLAGVPLYATLLSYERAGKPVLGVCCLPALGEAVWAEEGGGASTASGPARVAAPVPLASAIVATGSLSGLEHGGLLPAVAGLAGKCLALRNWCDAYGHFLVATGRVHAMLDPVVNPWDVSAVEVIVREAGGWFGPLRGEGSALSVVPGMREALLGVLEG